MLGYPKWASIQFIKRRWNQTCRVLDRHSEKSQFNKNAMWYVNHTYRRVQTQDTNFEAFFALGNGESRRDFLEDNPGRTAIVINVGAHVHSLANFSRSFDALLRTVDELSRPQDIIFFRNTAPGHNGCLPREPPRQADWSQNMADRPYKNYEEYRQRHGSFREFQWDLFESYNEYAKQKLEQRRLLSLQQLSNNNRPHIHLLNIFNSTILRPDGHVGFDDCLHYNLPGVTDWWVHFWYSSLLELATLEGV
uniref:Trichome birefringence-like C-terminal domain-containing protein n=1 Tax=Entomoneis paludosa TaxID=265537 RepID=A0A7S2YU40_9STRA